MSVYIAKSVTLNEPFDSGIPTPEHFTIKTTEVNEADLLINYCYFT